MSAIHGGLDRAARLMRQLGADAAPVWSRLTESEARAICDRMDHLPTDQLADDEAALEAFVAAAGDTLQAAAPAARPDVWDCLSGLPTGDVAALVGDQSPQVAAYILTRLAPRQAASVIRLLPRGQALAILRRMVRLAPPKPPIIAAIAESVSRAAERLKALGASEGEDHLARIFETLDPETEEAFLTALEAERPGTRDAVEARMLTFGEIARFDAAGLQTFLMAADRSDLALALKGLEPDLARVFFANMTQRAGQVLREEIELLGAVPRGDVAAARDRLAATARRLIAEGEIRPGDVQDTDLVE